MSAAGESRGGMELALLDERSGAGPLRRLVGQFARRERTYASLRMFHDVAHKINIADDLEKEAPVVIDAGLPKVLRFVVFLGAEGRVVEAFKQESRLLVVGLLYLLRRLVVCPQKMRRAVEPHFPVRLRFPGVEFGAFPVKVRTELRSGVERQAVWPRFASSKDRLRRASMMRRWAGCTHRPRWGIGSGRLPPWG